MNDDEILDFIFQGDSNSKKEEWKEDKIEGFSDEMLRKVKELEVKSIQKFQNSVDLKEKQEAIEMLNEGLSFAPNHPSLWNNRGQMKQLMEDLEGSLSDVEKAISLCNDKTPFILRQALTQRGMIKMRRGEEELAREDLERAAQLGSTVAAKEAAKLNPYAKLCNQMLAKAFANPLFS
eukprot:TRINITY_DN3864_c0_g1_i1.p2 TRINITY_DN3864_c0_g1~~TRINITY_DN3864_c0_g1_i1.p2  ORF type:complete len:178 (+),score=89.52 TRINITY_DN3864_c0_g1_i1:1617-2150(+)